MPEICRFYGIIIRMYFDDHPPPHFHAYYGGDEAIIGIENIVLLEGLLPPRALGLVAEWGALHQEELMNAWHRTKRLKTPGKIEPLK